MTYYKLKILCHILGPVVCKRETGVSDGPGFSDPCRWLFGVDNSACTGKRGGGMIVSCDKGESSDTDLLDGVSPPSLASESKSSSSSPSHEASEDESYNFFAGLQYNHLNAPYYTTP